MDTEEQLAMQKRTIEKLENDKENLKFENYKLKAKIASLEMKIEQIEEKEQLRDKELLVKIEAVIREHG